MPSVCPNCGEILSENARVCPECGSDEETGWSDQATGQRLDLPDDDFDYEEFAREEFGEGQEARVKPRGIGWLWWLVALGLVILIGWRFTFGR